MTTSHEFRIRPAKLFAFIKAMPFILLSLATLLLAWQLSPYFIFFSTAAAGMAWYRVIYIRKTEYLITAEIIRVSRGIFFKRIDQLEMYRIKDYVVLRPFIHQLFKIMDVMLKSTDPENPMVWLRGIPLSDLIDTIRDRVQEARKHNHIYEVN